MDITEIIKNLFSDRSTETVLPIINLLRENSFDLKKVAQNLTPEKIIPIVQSFAAAQSAKSDTGEIFNMQKGGALTIANVADKEIVYCLNRYLNAEQ
ncbi:MAG: hypothetical protein IJQ23_05370 [Clostridia bacterium]|nr:hypothetical protein [Clostridia bacterium]